LPVRWPIRCGTDLSVKTGESGLMPMEEKIATLGMLMVPHFSVSLDEVRLKTGKVSRRLRIDHPKAVAIVPVMEDRQIVMVRQFRYAVGKETLEVPAGKVDKGESVESAVRRELMEETGYQAGKLIRLLSYCPAIAYSNEVIEIFAVTNLDKAGQPLDIDEISSVEIKPLSELIDMISSGEIVDGKTIISLLIIEKWFQSGKLRP